MPWGRTISQGPFLALPSRSGSTGGSHFHVGRYVCDRSPEAFYPVPSRPAPRWNLLRSTARIFNQVVAHSLDDTRSGPNCRTHATVGSIPSTLTSYHDIPSAGSHQPPTSQRAPSHLLTTRAGGRALLAQYHADCKRSQLNASSDLLATQHKRCTRSCRLTHSALAKSSKFEHASAPPNF